jgi:predicted Fe-S protein YdhL (DUF1289 family)
MTENTDHIWKRDEIDSPCIKVCVVDPTQRICTGCYRSIDEITIWSRLSPEARKLVMQDLPNRAARLSTRRGGRAARLKRRAL